jgi:diguanylate cyclase (GGDEF)-like protein/PAS domain S-box-containing protein
MNSANSIISVIDKNGVMVDINPYGEKFTGFSKEEIASQPFFWKIFLPEYIRDRVLDVVEEAKKGNIVKQFQNGWISKSGEERIFQWSNALILDRNGEMEYITSIGVDITEQKRDEAKLRLLEFAINHISDAVYLSNQKEEFEYINRGVIKQTGFNKEEVLDCKLSDIDRDWAEYINSIREKKSVTLETIHHRKDGSLFPVEVSNNYLEFDGKEYVLSVARDISDRKEILAQLASERNRFALAIDGSRDGLWDWNLITDSIFFSERYETMLGYLAGELPKNSRELFEIIYYKDRKKAIDKIERYLESEDDIYENRFRMKAKNGSWKWILSRGKAQFNSTGKAVRFVGFNTDITEQMEYQEQLDHTAKHDVLTNLPNRFLLSELLTQEMNNALRSGQNLALLFIDLDGFKEVNDTFGHDAGDAVLVSISERMKKIVRKNDIISRLGGDEFVIVINGLKDISHLTPILKRFLFDLRQPIFYENDKLFVSASIGVSLYPQDEEIGNDALLRQADQAMYEAKMKGKNQFKFFNLQMTEKFRQQQKKVQYFNMAIKAGELRLLYQPKVNMKTGTVIGVEALVRWNSREFGLLYPDSFLIHIGNDSDLMIALGHWVFDTAFKQMEEWIKNRVNIRMSINVSSHELQHQDFPEFLKRLFLRHPNISPNLIEIELLETTLIEDFEKTAETLRKCQEIGVTIAIDDFGTGYSSLQYLKKLPMNSIKIDKNFIVDILENSSSMSIVEATVGLGQAFSTSVVAEGVESIEHGKILLQFGCHLGQGFGIAKPMSGESVGKWIKNWKGNNLWKTIEPIPSENRSILYASTEHRKWVTQVENYIYGKSKELPQLNSNKCLLGRWLIRNSDGICSQNHEFQEVKELHDELHKFAEYIIFSSDENKTVHLNKLHGIKREILAKFDTLINKICRTVQN